MMNIKTKNQGFLLTLSLVITLLSGGALYASSASDVITQQRDLPAFTSISLHCSADVFIRQGDVQQVMVKADYDLIDALRLEVRQGTLHIDMNSSTWRNIKVLEVHVVVPELDEIRSNASGDISILNGFSGGTLTVSLAGSGDLSADLNVNELNLQMTGSGDAEFNGVNQRLSLQMTGSGDVDADGVKLTSAAIEMSGSGDAELEGTVGSLVVSIAGSGDLDAMELTCKEVVFTNHGSGDCNLTITESLQALLEGSGDLNYRGDPITLKVNSTGSGDVNKY